MMRNKVLSSCLCLQSAFMFVNVHEVWWYYRVAWYNIKGTLLNFMALGFHIGNKAYREMNLD